MTEASLKFTALRGRDPVLETVPGPGGDPASGRAQDPGSAKVPVLEREPARAQAWATVRDRASATVRVWGWEADSEADSATG